MRAWILLCFQQHLPCPRTGYMNTAGGDWAWQTPAWGWQEWGDQNQGFCVSFLQSSVPVSLTFFLGSIRLICSMCNSGKELSLQKLILRTRPTVTEVWHQLASCFGHLQQSPLPNVSNSEGVQIPLTFEEIWLQLSFRVYSSTRLRLWLSRVSTGKGQLEDCPMVCSH